ncbi:hypothetical protein DF3PB_1170008 [uncultured Defluviicoccus sp.]|uniref:Uncharacterized protein n=1 Tax=metagenome TaxID=256318 RepID=A0A380T8C1_9ZZZZ|nr:hypothetical protein DF3PB_1170008 [uncultured Defluviicoccus sp.]
MEEIKTMIIWRNLDPRLLGQLLVAAAESLAHRHGTLCKQPAVRPPFRGNNTALGGPAPLCRRRSHP